VVAEQERGLVLADLRPGMVPVTFAEDVLAWAQSVDDPVGLWADATIIGAKAAEWKALGLEEPRVVAALRYLEIQLGDLLGDRPGAGARTDLNLPRAAGDVNGLIPHQRRSELQRFCGHAERLIALVRAALEQGKSPPSRRALLQHVDWIERPPAERPEEPPASRQHFDVWSFSNLPPSLGGREFFGQMPPQVVENLLWFWTEPGQMVVDPFGGSGTTLDVAEHMGRFAWASDLHPTSSAIHQHDITTGWPPSAPDRADLILLDPPYWRQAAGRYSDDPADLGNQALDDFMASWRAVIAACVPHLADGGRLAFIVSPTETAERVVDHAFEMYETCKASGLVCERRVIVTYQTQQATGQQVTWAREHRRLLKLYRDLVVMRASS
jgi:hypothetical protein